MMKKCINFSKREVDKDKVLTEESIRNSRQNNFMFIHKKQFNYVKVELLNKNSLNCISEEEANTFFNMGFISKEEFDKFIS